MKVVSTSVLNGATDHTHKHTKTNSLTNDRIQKCRKDSIYKRWLVGYATCLILLLMSPGFGCLNFSKVSLFQNVKLQSDPLISSN